MSDNTTIPVRGERNVGMAIAKGLAIIAMVMGHADPPPFIAAFVYPWHMPLFFIAAGYFFSEKNIDSPWEFIGKRFKKLYMPFLKWSIMFLVLHNLWFYLGILNEEFGNWSGGVTHPYSWRDAISRLVMIVTSMSGYDEFMAGAFWFFRGLLVSSIVFLVVYRLLRLNTRMASTMCVLLICLGCVAFTALRLGFGVKLHYYPNGGWRETWGIFFFGMGFLFRRYESRIPSGWWLILCGFAVMCTAAYFNFRGMTNSGAWRDLWSLPVSGCVGFLTVYSLSRKLADGVAGAFAGGLLTYVGNNTMPVYVFHIISYKVVSLLKIWWYDLDFGHIGCHMVVHYNNTDFFFVLYSVVGVALPLIVDAVIKRTRNNSERLLAPFRTSSAT